MPIHKFRIMLASPSGSVELGDIICEDCLSKSLQGLNNSSQLGRDKSGCEMDCPGQSRLSCGDYPNFGFDSNMFTYVNNCCDLHTFRSITPVRPALPSSDTPRLHGLAVLPCKTRDGECSTCGNTLATKGNTEDCLIVSPNARPADRFTVCLAQPEPQIAHVW